MKRLIESIRAARWLELTIAAGLICILLVLALSNAGGSVASDDETRMQRILSEIDGAGKVNVMIAEDEGGACTGVVVVASGAGDIEVLLRLQRAVQALTRLELSRIEIIS